jgi:hypothetical protein
MDAELAEDSTVTVVCEYGGKDGPISAVKPTKGTYHYRLYVPKGYNEDDTRRYPCMFIASPGGNADMGRMAYRLMRDRSIVVMLVESKNGPDEAPTANYLAAHDVFKRFPDTVSGRFAGVESASLLMEYSQ